MVAARKWQLPGSDTAPVLTPSQKNALAKAAREAVKRDMKVVPAAPAESEVDEALRTNFVPADQFVQFFTAKLDALVEDPPPDPNNGYPLLPRLTADQEARFVAWRLSFYGQVYRPALLGVREVDFLKWWERGGRKKKVSLEAGLYGWRPGVMKASAVSRTVGDCTVTVAVFNATTRRWSAVVSQGNRQIATDMLTCQEDAAVVFAAWRVAAEIVSRSAGQPEESARPEPAIASVDTSADVLADFRGQVDRPVALYSGKYDPQTDTLDEKWLAAWRENRDRKPVLSEAEDLEAVIDETRQELAKAEDPDVLDFIQDVRMLVTRMNGGSLRDALNLQHRIEIDGDEMYVYHVRKATALRPQIAQRMRETWHEVCDEKQISRYLEAVKGATEKRRKALGRDEQVAALAASSSVEVAKAAGGEDLLVPQRYTATTLLVEKYPGRSPRTPVAHIAPGDGFAMIGSGLRLAGQPLCKPPSKFQHGFLDLVPDGIEVCPDCLSRAKQWSIPLPDRVKKTPARPSTQHNGDFIGSNYNGGGFMKFGGRVRGWNWVMAHCVCARCGSDVDTRQSDERADGLNRDARYFTCEGPAPHVIKSASDLRRKISKSDAGATDARHVVAIPLEEVTEAYTWLVVSEGEDVSF
jgi:hypothetical protein